MTILESLKNSKIVLDFSILEFKNFSDGFYIKVKVIFVDNSELFLKEYNDKTKRNYSYHWQNNNGELLVRWDNAPHHRNIKTFPHHKHVKEEIDESYEVTLEDILKRISNSITHQ